MLILNSMGGMTFDAACGYEQIDLPWDLDSALAEMYNHRDEKVLLVLEGGEDVDPALYGEQQMHYTYCRDSNDPRSRDYRERAMFRLASALGFWVWGNCRGIQLMAALTGGKLYQDIGIEAGKRRHGSYHTCTLHRVGREIFCDAEGNPQDFDDFNSLHHQAVRVVPPGAEIIAESDDGLIEGLYWPGRRMCAVQWHPEFMDDFRPLRWIEKQMAAEATPPTAADIVVEVTSESEYPSDFKVTKVTPNV